MNKTQEPKYEIKEDKIVNRASGEAIPGDEPIMIFRARDVHAAAAIDRYLQFCQEADHRAAVETRLKEFFKWAEDHPDRMKEPDTDLSSFFSL